LQLTDLCLFTEARHTRHLSQADLHSAFQNHPPGLEHFPTDSLLLRPDEVLSGLPGASVLEVADNVFGVLFQAHHVRVGGLTSFGLDTDGNLFADRLLEIGLETFFRVER
jgi:hypothetical protein